MRTPAEKRVESAATELKTSVALARELRANEVDVPDIVWELIDLHVDNLIESLGALERERAK